MLSKAEYLKDNYNHNVNGFSGCPCQGGKNIKPLLRELLEDYDFSINEIKSHAKVSRSTVYRWLEQGAKSIPFHNYKSLLYLYCSCLNYR